MSETTYIEDPSTEDPDVTPEYAAWVAARVQRATEERRRLEEAVEAARVSLEAAEAALADYNQAHD